MDRVVELPYGFDCIVDGRRFGTWATRGAAQAALQVERRRRDAWLAREAAKAVTAAHDALTNAEKAASLRAAIAHEQAQIASNTLPNDMWLTSSMRVGRWIADAEYFEALAAQENG